MMDPAFEGVAETYDSSFTNTDLGRTLREIVRHQLANVFKPGDRLLELNCGTGEDAVWLAQLGIQVVATDVSPAMLECAARKAAVAGVSAGIDFRQLDISLPHPAPDFEFDGALSNFGGLNCVYDLKPLADVLGRSIRPRGRWIAVVLSRWCAWEILWHLIHLQPHTAFRRIRRNGTEARIGERVIRVWYPSIATLRRIFSPEFELKGIVGVGVFLPPTYVEAVMGRRKNLNRLLLRLERSVLAKGFRVLGDHILLDFERTSHRRDAS
jgi:ubiquinone/menaquinone biosynthesis C-methylase UbiE